ncbi:hypothetical protein FWK35_00017235, partial [Aphis craccivora]
FRTPLFFANDHYPFQVPTHNTSYGRNHLLHSCIECFYKYVNYELLNNGSTNVSLLLVLC